MRAAFLALFIVLAIAALASVRAFSDWAHAAFPGIGGYLWMGGLCAVMLFGGWLVDLRSRARSARDRSPPSQQVSSRSER